MPTFRSLHNPDFKLWSHSFRGTIVFRNGEYRTEDRDELRALRRHPSVEEVEERRGESLKSGPKSETKRFSGEFSRGGVLPKGGASSPVVVDSGHVLPHDKVSATGGSPKVDRTFDPNDPNGS